MPPKKASAPGTAAL
jgi:hypothetical protein